MVRLQPEPICWEELVAAVRSDDDGAVAQFLGVVRAQHRGRQVLHLEYHAYREMAESEMAAIERLALDRFQLSRVALVHRSGRVDIGEVSVAVAVAAPHRAEALDACRFIIDSLKARVPIWKKEHFVGGEVWIEGAGESPAAPQA